jgi:hypothetical protein
MGGRRVDLQGRYSVGERGRYTEKTVFGNRNWLLPVLEI